jgi:hypothetical protein
MLDLTPKMVSRDDLPRNASPGKEDDMMTTPSPTAVKSLRVVVKKVQVDGPVDDDGGDWSIVGKKGKVRTGVAGKRK